MGMGRKTTDLATGIPAVTDWMEYIDRADTTMSPSGTNKKALFSNISAIDTDGTLAANSDTKIASQKATRTYIANVLAGVSKNKGTLDCSANPNYPVALNGDFYRCSVAGKVGGASGIVVEVADLIMCVADNAGGTQASVGTSWIVGQANIAGITAAGLAMLQAADATAQAALLAAVTETLTNKRITPRVGSATSSATPTINTDNVDRYDLTAQAEDITSFTSNLSGTPTNGQPLWISVKGTAARAITWGASFENGAAALPTTTVSTDRLDVLFVWNAVTSNWRCVLTTASSGGGDATKLPLAGGTMDENAIVNLSNGSKWQQSTSNKGIAGDAGFSIICSAGYEYKFANGFLFILSDGSSTVRKVLYAPVAPTVTDDTTLGYTTDTTWEMADGTRYECTDVTEGAAVWAVVPTVSATSTTTLTNKRITQRTGTATSSATPTINTDNVDRYDLTAQAADITSFTSNLSGTPTNGQPLWISVKGTAARAITWGASFENGAAALPTTTVSTDRLDVLFVWNSVTSKWRCTLTAAPATDATKLPLAGGTMDENAVVNLFNGSKWQQSTPDMGIAGDAGFSIICSAGYEYKFANGYLFVLSDNSATVRKVLYAPATPTATDDETLGYTTDTTWEMADGTRYECTDVTEGAAVWAVVPTVSFATTATAAGTTTLTVTSATFQEFTGSTTQTLVMPDVTTLVLGWEVTIHNLSTGFVTVQANDASEIIQLGLNQRITISTNSIVTNTSASWSVDSFNHISGSGNSSSGTHSQISGSGNSSNSGDYCQISGSGNSGNSGNFCQISGYSNHTNIGTHCQISGSGNSSNSGARCQISGSGNSGNSGSYCQISGSSNSGNSGSYCQISGSGNYSNSGSACSISGYNNYSNTGSRCQISGQGNHTNTGSYCQISGYSNSGNTGTYCQISGYNNSSNTGSRCQISGQNNYSNTGSYSQISGYGNYSNSGGYCQISGQTNHSNSGNWCQISGYGNSSNSGIYNQISGYGNSGNTGSRCQISGQSNTGNSGNWCQISGRSNYSNTGNYCQISGQSNHSNTAGHCNQISGYGNHTNSGRYCQISGYSNTSNTGYYCQISGYSNHTNSGSRCQISGQSNYSNTGDWCQISGYNANGNTLDFARVHGGGEFARIIDVVAKASTTDATPTTLTLGGSAEGATNRINIPANSTWSFVAIIVARETATANAKTWTRRGLIGNNAGAVTISALDTIGTDNVLGGGLTATIAITADNTNDALKIEGTGVAATNIKWTAQVNITQVG